MIREKIDEKCEYVIAFKCGDSGRAFHHGVVDGECKRKPITNHALKKKNLLIHILKKRADRLRKPHPKKAADEKHLTCTVLAIDGRSVIGGRDGERGEWDSITQTKPIKKPKPPMWDVAWSRDVPPK